MNRKKTDTPAHWKYLSALLSLMLLIVFSPAAGYSGELILLYSNDIRGETDPCG